MEAAVVSELIVKVLVILAAGLAAGILCKRQGISLLVGYLLVGGLIGDGGLRLVAREGSNLEYIAEAGVLMLLFSIGLEVSFDELVRLSRFMLIGGVIQMLVVSVPTTFFAWQYGFSGRAALLAGSAAALSSTVLVFKALNEWGESNSPQGRRALGILLFQDIALVPLLLLVPLLTGRGEPPTVAMYLALAAKSVFFVAAVLLLRQLIARFVVPLLSQLRSVELVVLFSLCILAGTCLVAYRLGLTPAVGALAAGLVLSGNRLTTQIDSILLPYRESFSAVFFVSLGTLLNPLVLWNEPVLVIGGLLGMVLLKLIAATVALRGTGLPWRASLGMGLGLAQLGEFSFLLILAGVQQGLIAPADFNRMLLIALGTLIITPLLVRLGLGITDRTLPMPGADDAWLAAGEGIRHAIVIGMGPIGRQLASHLETLGVHVALVDLSPINLHPFAQQGFQTVAGDARDQEVLERAGLKRARLVIVCVPADDIGVQIVRAVREINGATFILMRCRYQLTTAAATKAGANGVVSEESEASQALLQRCERAVASAR